MRGISTRAVDDLVEAMGVEAGISKSEVSRICAGLDEIVGAFRTRPLGQIEFPYVYLDATYLHVRNTTGQVVSMAVVVATGIAADGSREILGCDVGDSEDETFWRGFLTALKGRGLSGVRLVISDQHAGLVKALRRCFQGAGHQRCRVHFARNLLAHVAKDKADMVAAMFRTIFAQPDKAAVAAAWDEVHDRLANTFPKIGPLMDDAKTEVLAFTAFPKAHWQKIWSTNPLERINKEIKRRSRVVGIFPNNAAVIRLVGAVLADMHDEWQAGDRRYLSRRRAVVRGGSAGRALRIDGSAHLHGLGRVRPSLKRVMDCLRDDLAVVDHVGVNAISHAHSGVRVCPFEQTNRSLGRNVGVLKCCMFRQFRGEHPRQFPHAFVSVKRTAVDQNHDVLGDVAS